VQAEHGPDSQVVLVALPGTDVAGIEREVARQCDLLPRAEVTRRALSHSCIVQVEGREEAAAFSNRFVGLVGLGRRGWGRGRDSPTMLLCLEAI
jgi:histidinol dehydrogenase